MKCERLLFAVLGVSACPLTSISDAWRSAECRVEGEDGSGEAPLPLSKRFRGECA